MERKVQGFHINMIKKLYKHRFQQTITKLKSLMRWKFDGFEKIEQCLKKPNHK